MDWESFPRQAKQPDIKFADYYYLFAILLLLPLKDENIKDIIK